MSPIQILQYASTGLGALYALSLFVNLFNPLIALRWPRLAAVLSTMGGHIADARQELGTIKMMRRAAVVGAGLLALLLVSCAAAGPITSVTEAACIAVVDVEAPELAPLCVFGDELAVAIEDYLSSHGGTAPAVVTSTATGRTAVPHDLYDAIARRPGVLARKTKPPVCKPAQGQVSP